jgi:nicotinamidase/pyrazinamidase
LSPRGCFEITSPDRNRHDGATVGVAGFIVPTPTLPPPGSYSGTFAKGEVNPMAHDVEQPALLIIDMVKDYFDDGRKLPITQPAKKIIDPLNDLIRAFRKRQWPIVFSTDAFQREDFIFKGRMHPHALAGSRGAEVIDELERRPEDLWLPKPRFSAFFQTGLEKWLRQREVTLCAVGGIATHFCVLSTALDAVCHDFKTVVLEDCTAAYPEVLHHQVLNAYRRNPIYPLLKVESRSQLMSEMMGN